MKTNDIKPEQGTLLISEPFLNDYYFGRSVVLLAEHNDEGSFGLILNKPVDIKLNEVIKGFPSETKLFIGGPVKTDNLFVLHTLGNKIKNSMKILEGIYWGGDINTIKKMLIEKKIKDDQIRFFMGYSGWSENQLETELEQHAWVLAQDNSINLLDYQPESMWKNIIKVMGDEYKEWLSYPIDPLLN